MVKKHGISSEDFPLNQSKEKNALSSWKNIVFPVKKAWYFSLNQSSWVTLRIKPLPKWLMHLQVGWPRWSSPCVWRQSTLRKFPCSLGRWFIYIYIYNSHVLFYPHVSDKPIIYIYTYRHTSFTSRLVGGLRSSMWWWMIVLFVWFHHIPPLDFDHVIGKLGNFPQGNPTR